MVDPFILFAIGGDLPELFLANPYGQAASALVPGGYDLQEKMAQGRVALANLRHRTRHVNKRFQALVHKFLRFGFSYDRDPGESIANPVWRFQ